MVSLLQQRLAQQKKIQENNEVEQGKISDPVSQKHEVKSIKEKVLSELVATVDTAMIKDKNQDEITRHLSVQIEKLLDQHLLEMGVTFKRSTRHRITGEIISEAIGYGPITPLLQDNTISEVMVNGPKQVYIERNGLLELTDIQFRDNDHVRNVIERIISPLGRRIDESSPMVDARLPDGSRVNAVIPPLAIDGPTITIRKFSDDPYKLSDLINFGTVSTNMGLLLKAAVQGEMNILVGGGTASGKTTTLNVLSDFIPASERIVTIEDAAELQLRQPHVVRMESRQANVEGKGRIAIRDLVINSLRMRPNRIIVGEVRGGEALDMLQAMNTGHDGSITTIHANSPRDCLSRLETMVLMAGVDLPARSIREQIASAIDLIVYQARLKDGSRKITYITEVVGMEGDIITLQDIFLYHQKELNEKGKVVGNFVPTGVIPRFYTSLKSIGVHVPNSIFLKSGD
ncbi:CpaF family protein [Metallumcola ferriviriculae]|uniref:CpaF family protein n=1 Tax=Metallumcola ferriviriculae TaxID=3039180 RepID=A0AAU0UK52_9FIRM|nr:CpaF family protein [Desulfitibacteraceae bacterium MK1]